LGFEGQKIKNKKKKRPWIRKSEHPGIYPLSDHLRDDPRRQKEKPPGLS
jgi:hypothetical protein